MTKKTFKFALRACTPVILGYLPSGFAFGLMITSVGCNLLTAVMMSLCIYTGAGQYLAVDFIDNNATYLAIAVSTFLINSKHLFYGLSLLEKYKGFGLKKLYLIFGLTDETYALMTGVKCPETLDERRYIMFATAINHLTWVFAGFLGALFGTAVKFDTTGLDFAMTALFLVIVTDQLKTYKTKAPFVIGVGSAFVAWLVLGKGNLLLGGAVLSVILLIIFRKRIEKVEGKEVTVR